MGYQYREYLKASSELQTAIRLLLRGTLRATQLLGLVAADEELALSIALGEGDIVQAEIDASAGLETSDKLRLMTFLRLIMQSGVLTGALGEFSNQGEALTTDCSEIKQAELIVNTIIHGLAIKCALAPLSQYETVSSEELQGRKAIEAMILNALNANSLDTISISFAGIDPVRARQVTQLLVSFGECAGYSERELLRIQQLAPSLPA